MPLLLTARQSFLNEYRVMILLNEAGPPIRVPEVHMVDTTAGVLGFEMIEGPRLGPEWPTRLDPGDLARAIAVAQTIGRFWPATPNLARLPITDHLRRYVGRGLLTPDDATTIASALAVRPIKWGFAHGGLSARTLINGVADVRRSDHDIGGHLVGKAPLTRRGRARDSSPSDERGHRAGTVRGIRGSGAAPRL